MINRITANTQSLQHHFAEQYREFFANCQRVASASNSFLWGGEFSGFYGGLTLGQKLPIRSYVGLETTSDNKVEVDANYVTYEPTEQHFECKKFLLPTFSILCRGLHEYIFPAPHTCREFLLCLFSYRGRC